jgi:hypothetical protein
VKATLDLQHQSVRRYKAYSRRKTLRTKGETLEVLRLSGDRAASEGIPSGDDRAASEGIPSGDDRAASEGIPGGGQRLSGQRRNPQRGHDGLFPDARLAITSGPPDN